MASPMLEALDALVEAFEAVREVDSFQAMLMLMFSMADQGPIQGWALTQLGFHIYGVPEKSLLGVLQSLPERARLRRVCL